MGGIEVDSPYAFTTSGMGSLNGHTFVKGINKLDGRAALAFCRERKSFANGDMQRNENQQLVMEGIIRKAVSSTTLLTKYTSILEAVQNNMETNMTLDEMSSLIKMQLDGMPSWNIQKQSIKGANGYDLCYALGFKAAIVEQDPVENAKATDNIIKVMTGKVEIEGSDGRDEGQN
jgi:anionic cell wall polymer biosynthesis LytR-Cps2A-Psr (LCP) family protein